MLTVADVCKLVKTTMPDMEVVLRSSPEGFHFTILNPRQIRSLEIGVSKFGVRDADPDIAANGAYQWACAYVFSGVKLDSPATLIKKEHQD